MSDGLFAKLDGARKTLARWETSREHTLSTEGRAIAEDRVAFWKQRVADLERMIREAAA